MQQIRYGVIDNNLAERTKNQIRIALLDLLDDLEQDGKLGHIMDEIIAIEVPAEFEKIKSKIKNNRGIGTSEILKGKTIEDLDQKDLTKFLNRVRVLDRLAEDAGTEDLSGHQKLLKLSLAENGHLYKGTYLCLGKTDQIEVMDFTASESKFAIFKGTVREEFLVLETVFLSKPCIFA